jgi:hypothetical protein
MKRFCKEIQDNHINSNTNTHAATRTNTSEAVARKVAAIFFCDRK